MTPEINNLSDKKNRQYSPSLLRDRRENIIRSLSEAIAAKPLAIVINYDEALAIVNALRENSG